MSSELNKIFPKSSIIIQKVISNALCFIDNKAVFSDKYLISENRLDIYQQSLENISLFYGFDTGISYEFEEVLTNSGVIIEGIDKNGSTLQNVTNDNTIVFVNGRLLQKDEFEILDSGSIALYVVVPQNLFQQILIYVSNTNIRYVTLSGQRINKIKSDDLSDTLVNGDHSIKLSYDINYTLVFINGIKVSSKDITENDKDSFFINADIKDTDLIEIYVLNNNIKSLNFYTTFGYMSYGPFDSNNNKIPILYNAIVIFDDIAKLVVDNLRQGFFIKENIDDGGVALVIDNNFETTNVRCIIQTGQDFQRDTTYFSGEYYVEAPTGKNIVDYLADFDKKFKLLPEILDVFHNIILKEVYDSINRLRDIRSISKVDSYHINKLIKLLGFDTNINYLTLRQKHALLEELNNFYRIVGTRDSYDMFNIIQDDIKIVEIEQLFTPRDNRVIDTSVANNGHYNFSIDNRTELPTWKPYYVGNRVYFNINDEEENTIVPFTFTVSEVDSQGRILTLNPDRQEGINYDSLEDFHELKPIDLDLNAVISTTSNIYTNNYTITDSADFYRSGVILTSEDNKYELEVTEVSDQGVITKWELIKGPTTSNVDISESDIPLRIKTDSSLQLSVTSTEESLETIIDTTQNNETGQRTTVLQPGYYKFDISGGGGGGASADNGGITGPSSGIYADFGENATRSQGYFNIVTPTTLQYIAGTGGGPAYAYWHSWNANNAVVGIPGAGYESGKYGIKKSSNSNANPGIPGKARLSLGLYLGTPGRYCVSGSGGGSSRIFINNVIDKVAPGGRGGKVYDDLTPGDGGSYNLTTRNTLGAAGGPGTNPSGTIGGGSYYPAKGKYWSYPGDNGWVKIYKVNNKYNFNILGDHSTLGVGDTLVTPNNEFSLTITSMSKDHKVTGFNVTPSEGSFTYNEIFPLEFVDKNLSAKLQLNSVVTNSTYNITSISGLDTLYLFEGAKLTATLSDKSKELFPEYTDFSVKGVIRYLNQETGQGSVSWDYSTANYNIPNFGNTPLKVSIDCGNGAECSATFIRYEDRQLVQEYVDFYTREELGAEHIKTFVKDAIDYGTITEGTPNAPLPYKVGKPDIDYGTLFEEVTGSENYGLITDFTGGHYVDYWLWERDPNYYPTNHVNIEIKIEASDNQENIINRFYKQFYDLASTVLYIHRLTCSYFFGNSTDNVSVGVVSPDTSTVFLGIQTGQPVTYEVLTLTSDPIRQTSDENIIH